MLLHPLRKDFISSGADLASDGGLGLFDAFFASLSMIIVSEVGYCQRLAPVLFSALHAIFFGAYSDYFTVLTIADALDHC